MALECLKLLLAEKASTLSSVQDHIIAGLVHQNVSVRRFFSARLQASVTAFFDEIYDRGDASAVCLDMVVLDRALWSSLSVDNNDNDKVRSHCERELFQLFIAKLMESGHDRGGRALKGIARLLAVDATSLQDLVDDESLDVIISSSDSRVPQELRSQATLAMVKYLDASKDTGETRFARVISKLSKGRSDNLIISCSAVAAVFPVIPKVTSSLFLSKEFTDSLSTSISRSRGRKGSERIQLAMLELLNAACIDGSCRTAISKNFSDWLSHLLSNGTDQTSELAAVTLTKIQAAASGSTGKGRIQEADSSIPELVDRFKGLMSKNKVGNLQNSVEGLVYSSIKPAVKEQLAEDPTFLREFIQLIKANSKDSSALYGGLVVIMNLTAFLPRLSEEQKKMSQLKLYANASGAEAKAGPDPLDNDEYVLKRCAAVTKAGIMPLLVECGKAYMPSIKTLSSKILLSLSYDRRSRGALAQQGAIRLLLLIASTSSNASGVSDETAYNASHALARILISVNPTLAFSSSAQITSAIPPLVHLLARPEQQGPLSVEQPRDLLPVFESLLALTNLASSPDPTVAEVIVREAWPTVEDLLLSSHTLIQKAACELICNLATCESGVVKFADGTRRAAQRLRILLALTDATDAGTRSATGGALAMLTDYDAVVTAIIDRPTGMAAAEYIRQQQRDGEGKAQGPRAVDLLLRLCQEEESGLAHRGVVCLQNMINASGSTGPFVKEVLKACKAAPILAGVVNKFQANGNVGALQSAIEVLKALVY